MTEPSNVTTPALEIARFQALFPILVTALRPEHITPIYRV